MINAEPPEPLTYQHSEIILFKQILQRIVGPAARHFCLFRVFCGLQEVDFSCLSWFQFNGLATA